MTKKRILYLDFAKAIAITLVCIGHSTRLVDLRSPSVLNQWIYSFHMPLFMFLSGFFSINAFNKPFKFFIKDKVAQLLIPVFVVSFFTSIVYIVLQLPDVYSLVRNEAIGGLWFLRTLFLCYLTVYIVKRTRLNDYLLCILTIPLALIIPHGYFLQYNFLLIFFWGGHLLRGKYDKYKSHRGVITFLSAIYFFLLGTHCGTPIIDMNLIIHSPLVIVEHIMTALSGALTIIGLSYYACKFLNVKFMRVLGRIGSFTLGIYVMQTIILERFLTSILHFNWTSYSFEVGDLIIIPLLGIISTILSYKAVLLFRKFRILDLLLFGGQYYKVK